LCGTRPVRARDLEELQVLARRLSLVAVPVAAAVVSLVVTAGPVLAAEPTPIPATAAAGSAVAPSAEHVRPIHELRTKQGFMFYTLSDLEAERAKLLHGFEPTGEAKGLGLYNKPVEGSVPVHRLRLVAKHSSYNEDELKKLRDDTTDAWNFQYEGVVGHILTKKAPGTVEVHRFSKDNNWRFARAGRADLLAAGYGDDGQLGFAPMTAG
jgi:hypothetical protein